VAVACVARSGGIETAATVAGAAIAAKHRDRLAKLHPQLP
jgi:hypothetical protein